jgi:phosphoglycolate phosphatase
MARKQFDFIVFDWDGTLMDSTSTIVKCIQAAARDLDLPIPDNKAASYVIGLGLQDAMQAAIPDLDPVNYPRMVERYRFHYLGQDHELTLFDGVAEMLKELAQDGYFLAVATGKSRVGLNRALNAAKLLTTLGQDLKRTLMVGDTTHDLQMAVNAGTASVAVSYGAHSEAELNGLHPLFCATSVMQLHDWLKSNG